VNREILPHDKTYCKKKYSHSQKQFLERQEKVYDPGIKTLFEVKELLHDKDKIEQEQYSFIRKSGLIPCGGSL
jgi:hypothetical protein